MYDEPTKEEQRARDLFYGLWIPDLFMKRVKDNQDWTLFCPNEAFDKSTGKGLMDVWGEEFEIMYARLEQEGKGRKTMKAQHLWFRILESQMETGTPYMLYKDHANRKSNQQNLGTIHCSNLCTEIIEQLGCLQTDSSRVQAVCGAAAHQRRNRSYTKGGGVPLDYSGLYLGSFDWCPCFMRLPYVVAYTDIPGIPQRTKLPYATWLPFRFPASQAPMVSHMTSKSFMKSPKLWLGHIELSSVWALAAMSIFSDWDSALLRI